MAADIESARAVPLHYASHMSNRYVPIVPPLSHSCDIALAIVAGASTHEPVARLIVRGRAAFNLWAG